MAQFDVRRVRSSDGLVVECQADLLSHLSTRFVIPMVSDAPAAASGGSRLTPLFEIDGEQYVLATHYAASVPARDLGEVVHSLADEGWRVTSAIDVLISGV